MAECSLYCYQYKGQLSYLRTVHLLLISIIRDFPSGLYISIEIGLYLLRIDSESNVQSLRILHILLTQESFLLIVQSITFQTTQLVFSNYCFGVMALRSFQHIVRFFYVTTMVRFIVTAAVYWGFISELAPIHLTFQHWAGVSPYTSSCDLAETCVFGKQSPRLIRCDPPTLRVGNSK